MGSSLSYFEPDGFIQGLFFILILTPHAFIINVKVFGAPKGRAQEIILTLNI